MIQSFSGFIQPKPDKNGYKFGVNKLTAGNNQFAKSPDVVYNNTDTWLKIKEIKIFPMGSIRVSYDAGLNDTQYGEAQVYINGIPRGILRTTSGGIPKSGSFATFTEDFTIGAGDLIQVYGHTNGNIGTRMDIKNLILSSQESSLSVVNL